MDSQSLAEKSTTLQQTNHWIPAIPKQAQWRSLLQVCSIKNEPSKLIFHPWNWSDHGTASWLSGSVSFLYQGHGSWNRNIGPDSTRQHFGWITGGIQTKPRLSKVVSKTSMSWWSTGLFPSGSMIFSQHSCRLLHVLKERHPQSRLTNIAPLNCEMLRFIPAKSWPSIYLPCYISFLFSSLLSSVAVHYPEHPSRNETLISVG